MQTQYLSGQETVADKCSEHTRRTKRKKGRKGRKWRPGERERGRGRSQFPTSPALLPGASSHVEVLLSFLNKLPLRRSPDAFTLLRAEAFGLRFHWSPHKALFPFLAAGPSSSDRKPQPRDLVPECKALDLRLTFYKPKFQPSHPYPEGAQCPSVPGVRLLASEIPPVPPLTSGSETPHPLFFTPGTSGVALST